MAARRLLLPLLAGAGGFAVVRHLNSEPEEGPTLRLALDTVPPRQEQLRLLSQGTETSPYDVLIIGGACLVPSCRWLAGGPATAAEAPAGGSAAA